MQHSLLPYALAVSQTGGASAYSFTTCTLETRLGAILGKEKDDIKFLTFTAALCAGLAFSYQTGHCCLYLFHLGCLAGQTGGRCPVIRSCSYPQFM